MVQTLTVFVTGADAIRQRTAGFVESGVGVVSFFSPVVVADHMTG